MNDGRYPPAAWHALLAHPAVDRDQSPRPPAPTELTVPELAQFLEQYGAKIVVKGGVPSLDIPDPALDKYGSPVNRQRIIEQLLPTLRERRADIIAHYEYLDVGLRNRRKRAERKRKIEAAFARAAARPGSTIWWCYDSAKKCVMGQPLKRSKRRKATDLLLSIPDAADFICVTGDSQWTALPQIVVKRKKDRLTKKAKRKSRRMDDYDPEP